MSMASKFIRIRRWGSKERFGLTIETRSYCGTAVSRGGVCCAAAATAQREAHRASLRIMHSPGLVQVFAGRPSGLRAGDTFGGIAKFHAECDQALSKRID